MMMTMVLQRQKEQDKAKVNQRMKNERLYAISLATELYSMYVCMKFQQKLVRMIKKRCSNPITHTNTHAHTFRYGNNV